MAWPRAESTLRVTTAAPSWTTSSRVLPSSLGTTPSSWLIGLLSRPDQPFLPLTTQTPPSLSSASCFL